MSCQCHTEVVRDGSGQLDRYLKALDPAYAPVDDRSIEDLLVFAKRYASQIRFYDLPDSGIVDSTPSHKISWREFFRRDMAVIAASIATTDFSQVKKDYDETRKALEISPEPEKFSALFKPILGMVSRIDRWYSVAIPENPLYNDLTLGIQSQLKDQLQTLRNYEEGFKLVDPSGPLEVDYSPIENVHLWGLDQLPKADVTIYKGATAAEKILHAALYIDDVFLSFFGFVSNLVDSSDRYVTFAREEYPSHLPHMALFLSFLKLFRHAQDQMNGITGRMLNYYYRDVLQLKEKPSVPDRVHLVFELAKDVAEYDLTEGTSLLGGSDAGGKEQVYKTGSHLVINQAKVKELKTIYIEKVLRTSDNGQEEEVLSSIYARPVANSLDGYGEKFNNEYPVWPALGRPVSLIREPKNICDMIDLENDRLAYRNETQIGFAVASPHLVLQGGRRLIAYRLNGLAAIFDESITSGDRQIQLLFTGADEWIEVARPLSNPEYKELFPVLSEGVFPDDEYESGYFFDPERNTLLIYLSAAAAPVVGYHPSVHNGVYTTSFPVMQVLMGAGVAINATAYRSLQFSDSSIEVRVGSMHLTDNGTPFLDGLKTLTVQNDDQEVIDTTKTFDPFTAFPSGGKSLYIGSDEVFNKSVDQLSLNVLLADETTVAHHVNFGHGWFGILENRQWKRIGDQNFSAATQNFIGDDGRPLNRLPLTYNERYTQDSLKGFLRMRLGISFADSDQSIFEVMHRLALTLKVAEISLSYHATQYFLEPGVDQFFHVYPFGVLEADLRETSQRRELVASLGESYVASADLKKSHLAVKTQFCLLPQFTYLDLYARYRNELQTETSPNYDVHLSHGYDDAGRVRRSRQRKIERLMLDASGLEEKVNGNVNQYSGTTQEEGMLFIGLEKLKPLQMVSLLFQFAEGTAEDEDNDPPVIHWSYLSNNEWRPLKAENVVSDGTYGFQTTGIVRIDVPADATNNNTIITPGLHWFCASVTENSHSIPKLIDVVAQAVEARFDDQDNDQRHFDKALPAGSISKLQVKVDEVSKVIQPFASWNGKPRESGTIFYTRVSERLRHKNRAINAWDYEHLILDRFREIYKVKAITHVDPNCLCRHPEPDITVEGAACCGSQIAPGHVLVVPIPNLMNRHASNPLQPKTGRRTLLEIQDYLKVRTSPFVKVHARNPLYEEVIVFFRVKFYGGVDKGYHLKKLNEEIVRFLTPWAFDEHADVKFGEKIYASSVINFIEERPYVDFITDFIMGVCKDSCCGETEEDKQGPPRDSNSTISPPTGSRTILSGQILDSATSQGVEGVRVVVDGTATETWTDPDGRFELLDPAGTQVTLGISHSDYYERRLLTGINSDWVVYLHRVSRENNDDRDDVAEMLSKMCGCVDFEKLLQEEVDENGVTVAVPSTARSILVSSPKHIIVPYEEPDRPDPCAKLAKGRERIMAELITRKGLHDNATDKRTDGLKRGKSAKEKSAKKSPRKSVRKKKP